MKKLHEQVQAGIPPKTKEQLDRKIKNTVAKWWRNESIGYLGFKKKGKNDFEFFAHNFAKANVDKADGWEFTKQTLSGFCSIKDEHKAQYDAEYSRTPFSQKFRDKFETH